MLPCTTWCEVLMMLQASNTCSNVSLSLEIREYYHGKIWWWIDVYSFCSRFTSCTSIIDTHIDLASRTHLSRMVIMTSVCNSLKQYKIMGWRMQSVMTNALHDFVSRLRISKPFWDMLAAIHSHFFRNGSDWIITTLWFALGSIWCFFTRRWIIFPAHFEIPSTRKSI